MNNPIRIKRRAAGGASGAPTSLANAELAYNEQDDTLYYGKGTGGAGGTATQVVAIGGPGAFLPLTATADAAKKLATARTINGVAFDGSANITINAVDSTARIASSEKGAANGVATLGADGKVPAAQLPSFVDDVLEYANLAGFPATGSTSTIYVALDTNKIYRWSGSTYVEISVGGGTADAATKLSTARTITLTGAVSGSLVFDGSADVSIDTSLSIDGGTSDPNPETLTYTYTGVLDAPITSLPGTAEMVVASPLGKERAYGILLSSANARLTGVEFPNLEFIGTTFIPNNMIALTSLSLPALTKVGSNFSPNNMGALTSLSLPALTTVGSQFVPYSMAALTSLSLPAVEVIGATLTSGNAIQINNNTSALTSFTLPTTLKQVGGSAGNVIITSAALNQASMDNILERLAALDGTNGTAEFRNRTVTITGTSSTPSAAGLAAKATLVARGCTVTHN